VRARVQLRRPQTHHPDQPAAHTAFQTHHLRVLVLGEQYRPSIAPFARAGARCPFSPLLSFKAMSPRRGSARVAHGPIFRVSGLSELGVVCCSIAGI
jgi:hypothetical protein